MSEDVRRVTKVFQEEPHSGSYWACILRRSAIALELADGIHRSDYRHESEPPVPLRWLGSGDKLLGDE